MFAIFRKKSELEKLKKQYAKLLAEAYKLSHSNRKASDSKYAEADALASKIEVMEKEVG